MKGFLSPSQRDRIIKEIKKGNPFDWHVAKIAGCSSSTVKKYRQHIKEGRNLLYYEGL